MLCIARPGDPDIQRVTDNGHKRNHALKFEVIMNPDCLIPHSAWCGTTTFALAGNSGGHRLRLYVPLRESLPDRGGVPTPRDGEPGIANQLVSSLEDIGVGQNRVTLYSFPTVTTLARGLK